MPSAAPSARSRTARSKLRGDVKTLHERLDRTLDRPTGRLTPLHAFLVEPLAQEPDPVAAPEQLAVEDEGRHAEHTRGLGLAAQAIVFCPALACQERRETRRGAGLDQQRLDRLDALRIELTAPEALEGLVVVGAETPCCCA